MGSWKTQHFVLGGILGALTFALAFALGSGIILATGIPATGGVANIFVAMFVVLLGLKLVPKFGFATLVVGLLFTFAVPTVIGGPPGVYKIVNGIIIGLIIDLVAFLGRYRGSAYIAAGTIGAMASILAVYSALLILSLPGADRLAPLVLPLTLLQGVFGGLAGFAAVTLFERRLKRLGAVQRLSES